MTFITISTIGYGEVIELSPAGRVFTMLIALMGVGTLTYTFSIITATLVEGNLTDAFRHHKMEKKIEGLNGHYMVCCAERVGSHIIAELHTTLRPVVIVEQHQEHLEAMLERFPQALGLLGESSDNDVLTRAGIERAGGLFAAHDDDNTNLVLCLTARHMNPSLRIIAHCREPKNIAKMKRAGANSVVSAEMIGGLRMASEMARPAAVTFLDLMLRDKDRNLRIEEVTVPARFEGKTIEELQLKKICNLLLMALCEKGEWIYNPGPGCRVREGSTLIFMGTPQERIKVEKAFQEST
jgi:voltage-gated potassium channel